MSRIAKQPVKLPTGVELTVVDQMIKVKGGKGELTQRLHPLVKLEQVEDNVSFSAVNGCKAGWMHAGTIRALVNNMVTGVNDGFERKLTILGVGYRAQVQGKNVNLTLGFSHPIVHELPEGVTAEAPSQTELVLKGVDKQKVGQAASEIRAYRPPEAYKGKGVRYSDEQVRRKEAKKK